MPSFREVENSRPPGNVVVPPTAWSTTWEPRPDDEVCIGLRFVADADLEDARVEAYRRAVKLYPNHTKDPQTTELWIASFQDALVRWIIARGTCNPNDARLPWHLFEADPEEIVRDALTDKGAQLLFDGWERMRIAADIGTPIATDADILQLEALLPRLRALDDADRARALRNRRLLRFVLEDLEDAPEPVASAAE